MENLVIIATCQEPKEAYYLKYRLGLEGIDSILQGTRHDKTENLKELTGPLKVQVLSSDVEKAIQILFKVFNEIQKNHTDENTKNHKRILVPIDFSKNSFTASLFAFTLAKSLGAEIQLLHVYNDPFIDSAYVNARISLEKYERNVLCEIEEMARRNIVAFVQALQSDLQKYGLENISFHYNLLKGKPETEIINISDLFSPFMIVLGTQGTSKMSGDNIGSVATKVIENTDVPVLAIPENWSYTNLEKIKILYATDFQNSDLDTFSSLVNIMRPYANHYDCVHIETDESKPWHEMQMFKLESDLCKNHPDMVIKCHIIQSKNLMKGILEFIDKAKTNIISFTSPKRSALNKIFFPNNLKKMVSQSKIPLLIFHPFTEKSSGND
jgi:nucleotide-binding universal stress UspA family protein